MSEVFTIIETKNPSAKSVNYVLHKLLQDDRLEEAAQVGQILCQDQFLDQLHYQTQKNIQAILRRYQDANDVEKIVEFVGKLSGRANILMRGEIWIKASLIKCSTDSYLEHMFKNQEDSKKWMVNTEVLLEAVDSNPSLPARLEELASGGF